MKPLTCCVCRRLLKLGKGAPVAFADYDPLPGGQVGHPAGLEWFCDAHMRAALQLQHWNCGPAIAKLRAERLRNI